MNQKMRCILQWSCEWHNWAYQTIQIHLAPLLQKGCLQIVLIPDEPHHLHQALIPCIPGVQFLLMLICQLFDERVDCRWARFGKTQHCFVVFSWSVPIELLSEHYCIQEGCSVHKIEEKIAKFMQLRELEGYYLMTLLSELVDNLQDAILNGRGCPHFIIFNYVTESHFLAFGFLESLCIPFTSIQVWGLIIYTFPQCFTAQPSQVINTVCHKPKGWIHICQCDSLNYTIINTYFPVGPTLPRTDILLLPVGLKPQTPQNDAGILALPPESEQTPNALALTETRAASPPLLPPLIKPSFHGFLLIPYTLLFDQMPSIPCGTFECAYATHPFCQSSLTTSDVVVDYVRLSEKPHDQIIPSTLR